MRPFSVTASLPAHPGGRGVPRATIIRGPRKRALPATVRADATDLVTDTSPIAARPGRAGRLATAGRPLVMGILNVTPDSFSDGGRHADAESAFAHARRLVAEGADIVDVGGESTRPGAAPVPLEEELERVLPVIERIAAELDVLVSIDTSRPEVMEAAATAGAGLINDVRALRLDGALDAAVRSGLPVCLMHMQGTPRDMQDAPRYDDPVAEVHDFLAERRRVCLEAGMDAADVLVDPGFGFGKTLAHNLALLRGLGRLAELGPVLAGLSRKGMIGALIGDPEAERAHGSVAAALYAVERGASIVRVHDVGPTVRALAVWRGVAHG